MYKPFIPIVALCAVVLTAFAASAQTPGRPDRPYRGLFGPDTSTAGEVLSVNGSVSAGYDTDVVAEQDDPSLPPSESPFRIRDAVYSMVAGGLNYSRDSDKVDLGASLFSSARYYPSVSDFMMPSYGAAVGASLALTDRTQFSANEAVSYQPWQVLAYFPTLFDAQLGHTLLPNQDFATGANEYWNYMTSVGLTHQLSQRTVLAATYAYQFSDFTANGSAFNGDFASQIAWARLSRGITRNLGWHAGYGYTEARYLGTGGRYRGDTLDIGLDYSRALSITRRTKLSFSTGATAIREGDYTRYQAMGTAILNREVGRSWLAAAAYTRNVAFIESMRTPYFYDGINLGLTGLITRRLSFQSGAGATSGTLGVVPGASHGNGFDTAYGSLGLAFAISRHLSASVDYVFYAYSMDPAAFLNYGLAPNLNRQGVRVSLNAWAPIFERGRRPNATR
jgi:hypothetical protein